VACVGAASSCDARLCSEFLVYLQKSAAQHMVIVSGVVACCGVGKSCDAGPCSEVSVYLQNSAAHI
jgi:hypothetical protein